MGFKDLIKTMTGESSETSNENRRLIQEAFNEKVSDSEHYTVVAMAYVKEKKSFKLLRSRIQTEKTYYNYIVGFSTIAEPTMILIPISADLNKVGEPVRLLKGDTIAKKKSNDLYVIESELLENKKTKLFLIKNTLIGATNSGFIIRASYLNEAVAFDAFFKNFQSE